MPRPVILEGPDGAGKSTLGAKLAKDLGWPFAHTGGAAKDGFELVSRMSAIANDSAPRLYDRCPHISDAVYKKALGIDLFIPEETAHSRLAELGPFIVFCRLQSPGDMLEHMSIELKAHKPEQYRRQVIHNHGRIVFFYDQVMAKLQKQGFRVIWYDWTKDRYEDVLGAIKLCAA